MENAHKAFSQHMEGIFGEVDILYYKFSPAEALKQLDPIAYRQEFLAWLDEEQKDYWEGEVPLKALGVEFADYYDQDGDFDEKAYLAACIRDSRR